MLHFIVANLSSDFFRAVINCCSNIAVIQLTANFVGIVIIFVWNREDNHLVWSQPQWEMTGGMFNEDSHKTFHWAKWCTVNHHRAMFLIVSACVFKLEALWKVIINLDCSQLPTSSNCVLHHEVEFRTIECGFAIFHTGFKTFFFACLNNGLLGMFPILFRTDIFVTVYFVAQWNLCFKLIELQGAEDDHNDVHHS